MAQVKVIPEPVLAAMTAQLLPGLAHLHKKSHMVSSCKALLHSRAGSETAARRVGLQM